MRIVYPLEFELNPKEMDNGVHPVTLKLRNIGKETIQNLDVKLQTLDSYSIRVVGAGDFVRQLAPQEEVTIGLQVEATVTSEIYVSVSGTTSKGVFSVDSPWVTISVIGNVAELLSVFAVTMPYTPMGNPVKIEGRVRGIRHSTDLTLEFWAKKPSGDVVALARIWIAKLAGGEEQCYSAELMPKEEGFYTIYGYLYDKNRRIGLKTDTIWVEKQLTAHSILEQS